MLRELHWLPVRQRVDFKVACLAGGAEIDGPDSDGPWKLRGMKLADLTLADQIAEVDIDGPQLKQ